MLQSEWEVSVATGAWRVNRNVMWEVARTTLWTADSSTEPSTGLGLYCAAPPCACCDGVQSEWEVSVATGAWRLNRNAMSEVARATLWTADSSTEHSTGLGLYCSAPLCACCDGVQSEWEVSVATGAWRVTRSAMSEVARTTLAACPTADSKLELEQSAGLWSLFFPAVFSFTLRLQSDL